jgi:hypothetical protein
MKVTLVLEGNTKVMLPTILLIVIAVVGFGLVLGTLLKAPATNRRINSFEYDLMRLKEEIRRR